MPFELQIALRYLLAKRRQVFISVISLVSTLGVTVGVMALVIALAIMTGPAAGAARSHSRLDGARLRVEARRHRRLPRRGRAARSRCPASLGGAPADLRQGADVERAATRRSSPSRASIPRSSADVTEVGRAMTDGSLDGLDRRRPRTALPASSSATIWPNALGAFVGDTVTIVTPQGTLSPFGMLPRQRRFQVVGHLPPRPARVRLGLRLRLARHRRRGSIGHDAIDHLELRVADLYAAPRDRRQHPATCSGRIT